MPIRPIDPAKRARNAAAPVTMATAPDKSRGAYPNPALEASGANPDTIRTRSRLRRVQPAERASTERNASIAVQRPGKRLHYKVERTGPNWTDNGDYLVGKGRPPKASQWQKGQSGNPRGPKPREKLDPQAAFDKEILAEFTAKVNGEDVTLNMGTFALQLLKGQAAKGSVRSAHLVLETFAAALRRSIAHEGTPEIQPWEQEMLDRLLEDYGRPAKPVVRKIDRSIDGEDVGS